MIGYDKYDAHPWKINIGWSFLFRTIINPTQSAGFLVENITSDLWVNSNILKSSHFKNYNPPKMVTSVSPSSWIVITCIHFGGKCGVSN